MSRSEICRTCGGSGGSPRGGPEKCSVCGGHGFTVWEQVPPKNIIRNPDGTMTIILQSTLGV